MKKILLHICCGVCAFSCINRLKEDGFYVEGFFYNPNIFPGEEYLRRKEAAKKACEITSVKLNDGDFTPDSWENLFNIWQ